MSIHIFMIIDISRMASLPNGEIQKLLIELQRAKNKYAELNEELFPDGQKWNLSPNKYPYWFEDNLTHYILWFNPGHFKLDQDSQMDQDKQLHSWAEELIKLELPHTPLDNVIYFRNTKANRSVPGLDHCHVVVKDKQNSSL